MRLIKALTLAMSVLQSFDSLGRIRLGHDRDVNGRQTVALRCHFRRHGHIDHDRLLSASFEANEKATTEVMALKIGVSACERRG